MLSFTRWILLVLALLPGSLTLNATPLGIALNEDDSHFFISRSAEQMTLEGLQAWVDQYAGTQVSHLFLSPNAMKASYRSEVWDAIWDIDGQVIPEGDDNARRWVDNARLLHERGLDPYAVWIDRCREKGLSPWLSMRMNDVHNVDDPKNYIHNHFWVDHPDYWRVPGSAGAWVDRAFDYGIPEVREHHMKFVRELLERYDPDGLELDWMRFGYHFKPGHEKEGAEILTELMREVRALTQSWSEERGHPIRLGARVPTHPDAAVGLGMDGVRWVREGLVDVLVPSPFWATTDFDIPLELWRERVGPVPEGFILAPGCEILSRAYPGAVPFENDLASTYGFAASGWSRGADQIYLFNYMDPEPMRGPPGSYRSLLEKGLDPKTVTGALRRHPVTYRDTVPPGFPDGAALPIEGRQGATFQIHTGPKPSKGRATFLVGLAARERVAEATFEASVNGASCEPQTDYPKPDEFPGVARAIQFEFALSTLKEGYNQVAVQQLFDQEEQLIVWAELRFDPGSLE